MGVCGELGRKEKEKKNDQEIMYPSLTQCQTKNDSNNNSQFNEKYTNGEINISEEERKRKKEKEEMDRWQKEQEQTFLKKQKELEVRRRKQQEEEFQMDIKKMELERKQKEQEQIFLKKQKELQEKINKQKEEEQKLIKIEEEKKEMERKKKLIEERKRQEKQLEMKEELKKKMYINPELMSEYDFSEMEQYKIINKKKEEEKKESMKFYDMILDFSSFEQLKKDGWVINFSNEGKKKYEKSIIENNITIGILGNKNRGKSYLLGRIIGKDNYKNPNGFLVTTQGISANFPILEENDNVFITLDTAGKDNPLLGSTIFKNDGDKEKRKKEYIKKIARDQKVTEIVLADFIIQESDILITVLEQLSFAEQDMLKNLINQLKQKKKSGAGERKLIVIHNLMNITKVNEIQKFIVSVLKRSLTFSLEEQKMSNFKDDKKNIDDTKKFIYVQKKTNIDKLEIVHLIIGNDNDPEIKKEYNEPAFRYIRKAITIATQRKFDLITLFKDFITTNSQKYLNGEGFDKNSLKIDDSKYNDHESKKSIKLDEKDKQKIDLKGVRIDSRGIHNFLSSIEPRYTTKIIERDNKLYILIEFEMFGKLNPEIKTKVNIENNKYFISVGGKVEEIEKNETKDNLYKKSNGNLEYSEFFFQVIIEKYFPFKNEEGKIEEKKEYNIIKILDQEKPEKIDDIKYGIYKLLYQIEYTIIDNSDDSSEN